LIFTDKEYRLTIDFALMDLSRFRAFGKMLHEEAQ
jgi:hypothetical protein